MSKKSYLEISRSGDIKKKTEKILYRCLEMVPGILSVGTLLGVFIFSWILPSWVAIFMICFCFYYLFRVFYFALHQITGYFKVQKHLQTDWFADLQKIKDWQRIHHLVILPHFKEGLNIIEETLESILQSQYPKENIIIVLTTEERAGKEYQKIAKKIEVKYAKKFGGFLTVTHPDNIEGEIAGKGSNIAYAGKEAKGLIASLSIPYEDMLVSTFDIDTKTYPQYFACLTWYYLTEANPLRASYQPVPVYNNNIWTSSFFTRVVSTSNTFWQMIQQERAEQLTTYSSHAIPAKVFFSVGYPANIICDDSRMFWRAYFYYDGQYRVVPIYYLVSMDSVDAKNVFKTAINQYKQQRRWAWGCIEIPYVIFGFLKNKKISLFKKLHYTYILISGYWSWATAALLLFILGWLPLLLGGRKFNFTVLSFNLPIFTSRIMTVALAGVLVSAFLSVMLLPRGKDGPSLRRKISIFLQWVFLPIILIVFGSFPALDAQIRLMFGKYMGFWVTEKIRK